MNHIQIIISFIVGHNKNNNKKQAHKRTEKRKGTHMLTDYTTTPAVLYKTL